MLVGGDICKALLKQEIRFRGLFPWTSLWFVVGFVLFCVGCFFSKGAKRFTRCFSGALEVFSGKIIEMLNLPAALQRRSVTVKQWLEQQAPVNVARRKLVMERSKSGDAWGRLCWGRLGVGGDVDCSNSAPLCHPSPPLPLQLGPGSGTGSESLRHG